jgi:myo-inositol 2-dehydrogenase / D-chiro-inositol 1-dehydrogenase
MLRIALLGCGRIGVMHATNIASHRRAELAGVFDIRADAAMRSVKDGRTVKVSEIA